MNKETKRLVEEEAKQFDDPWYFTYGASFGYSLAIDECIGIVKQHRIDGKILWDIITALQQLKKGGE